MTTAFFDRVKFSTGTNGTGPIVAGAPLSRYRSPVQAAIPDGAQCALLIEMGAAWEVSTGVWNQAAGTFTRVLRESYPVPGALLNLDGTGVVTVTVGALEMTAALTGPGYVPVNKAGDTMTGNLSIAPAAADINTTLYAPATHWSSIIMGANGNLVPGAFVIQQNGADNTAILTNGSAAPMTFATGGVEKLRIDKDGVITQTGRNAAVPTMNTIKAPAGGACGFEVLAGGSPASAMLSQGTDGQAYVLNQANATLNFGTNATTRMTIAANGRVSMAQGLGVTGGINTDGVTLPLTGVNAGGVSLVGGDALHTGYIAFLSNTGSRVGYAGFSTAGDFSFSMDTNAAIHFQTTGGITTNGPATLAGLVTVNADMRMNGDIHIVRPSTNTGYIFYGNDSQYFGFDGGQFTTSGKPLASGAITTSGNNIICGPLGAITGIGGWNGVGLLAAQAQLPYGYAGHFYSPGGTYGATSMRVDATNQYLALFSYQGTVIGSITTPGNATSFNTTSDERLKTFRGRFSAADALAIITADPVRAFTWNEKASVPGEDAIGWGAQTSYAVAPSLATPPGDEIDGDPEPRFWSMDYGKRTPYLWAAIGAHGGILDQLADLTKQVADLTRKLEAAEKRR